MPQKLGVGSTIAFTTKLKPYNTILVLKNYIFMIYFNNINFLEKKNFPNIKKIYVIGGSVKFYVCAEIKFYFLSNFMIWELTYVRN